MVLNANSKNVHHTNLYPSVHPSPRVPDVLPEDGTPACTPYIFAILVSRQGMIRGQNSSGGESGLLNNQIEIKFYSKLDDGLSAQLFPAQKPIKKNNNKNIQ